MDYGEIIKDSIGYSRNALIRNWKNWLVFILCSLPFALMMLLLDPEKIQTADYWIYFPWAQFIGLLLAGFILSFFTSGYIVRVFRSVKSAPVFDNWGQVFTDGIKLTILEFIWILPTSFFLGAAISFLMNFTRMGGMASPGLRLVLVLLVFIAIVLTIATILCIIPGSIRFARTGSIREGIRFFALMNTVGAIGLGSYILALVILLITAIVFFLVISVFALIPFIGWVLNLAFYPFFVVFAAHYVSRVYDYATPPAPAVTEPASGT